ncbi:MAG: HAD-IA family hydrolase [Lachnospiraceae bacterium]|nr:HAD-IA family hydrolase [Lachnospiraceae bacterium]
MEILKLTLGACRTNVYIVATTRKNAVLIDPADEADKIADAIEKAGLRLKYVFLTHGHTDHVLALQAVKERFGVPVVISKDDAYRLEDEELINSRPYVTVPYKAVAPDILITEETVFRLDELTFRFFAMPGHTEGSLCVVTGGVIFSGDTLMFEGHGRTDLPGGNEEELVRSMKRLVDSFPDDYKVLPGHREETTVGHEKAHNPYLKKEPDAKPVRNVVFDLGKVLVDFEPERCMETLGFSEDAKNAFREKIFPAVWEECDLIPYGDTEVRERFKSCLPGFEAEVDRLWDDPTSITREYAYAADWIRDLKAKGLNVYILSNYGRRAFEINSVRYGFLPLTDGQVISYDVQCVKPAPEIFRILCERFGVIPEESVFIDDREENVAAAEAMGFQGIVFKDFEAAKERLERMLA